MVPNAGRQIIAIVVFGVLIVVGAFQHFPIIETLPPLRWDITGTAMPVHVPLADISRVVTAPFKSLADTLLIGRHPPITGLAPPRVELRFPDRRGDVLLGMVRCRPIVYRHQPAVGSLNHTHVAQVSVLFVTCVIIVPNNEL